MKGMRKEIIEGRKFSWFCSDCKLYAYTAGDARRHVVRVHKIKRDEAMTTWPIQRAA